MSDQAPEARVSLTDGQFFFAHDGKTYTLDLIESCEEQERIRALVDEAVKDGKTKVGPFYYLHLFGSWLEKQGWPKLRPGLVDAVYHGIRIGFMEAKKKQQAEYERIATSPTSTELTPEA